MTGYSDTDAPREARTAREQIMEQWDRWRAYIANGGGGSWPRDAFESLLDNFEDRLSALKAERDETLQLLQEANGEKRNLSVLLSDAIERKAKTLADLTMLIAKLQNLRSRSHSGLVVLYDHELIEIIEALQSRGPLDRVGSDEPRMDHPRRGRSEAASMDGRICRAAKVDPSPDHCHSDTAVAGARCGLRGAVSRILAWARRTSRRYRP